MKVHHLNCGTMRLPTAHLVCHVLLLESGNGLVLVDTGFGLADIEDPARRLGPYRHLIKPALDPAETAAHQVERLGHRRADVRHIVLTHLDIDHIGGLADFPHARVHLTAAEAEGAIRAPSRAERIRYSPAQWAHRPHLVEHTPDGEQWWGFPAALPLDEVSPGIVLIALPGHTRGHAAVAVDAGDRWILHCGDAFYHTGTLDRRLRVPAVLRLQETLVAFDRAKVRDNHARLAELYQRADPRLSIVCSHDPVLYQQARAGA
ncbi:MBL fold metallo-hydrolase [Nonomuraea sp. LP-02]|uniref:MBL fold metallo-hydrolase n=1 Tax=Nonomuraea sp. LP-02 TaxID=3097960 RepID=UPI002E35D8E0|nr:MBL fold metallo-hydrolase [Nonomuraea sp. LP-02]MED7930463.1 MBL fold metallo-hydrolase [Nonomuraea sp. LP-02]